METGEGLSYQYSGWQNEIRLIWTDCAQTTMSRHGNYKYPKTPTFHDDVIKWKHFPRYWSFLRGIYRSPVNSPHKGQWRGALVFSLICVWINGWENNREAGDLRRYRAHYDITVMLSTPGFGRYACALQPLYCTQNSHWLHNKQEALSERRPLPRLIWGMWNILFRYETTYPNMFQNIPFSMPHLFWYIIKILSRVFP